MLRSQSIFISCRTRAGSSSSSFNWRWKVKRHFATIAQVFHTLIFRCSSFTSYPLFISLLHKALVEIRQPTLAFPLLIVSSIWIGLFNIEWWWFRFSKVVWRSIELLLLSKKSILACHSRKGGGGWKGYVTVVWIRKRMKWFIILNLLHGLFQSFIFLKWHWGFIAMGKRLIVCSFVIIIWIHWIHGEHQTSQ